eukprot:660109-Prorocentrum_minimum.AAC.1
MARVHSTPQTSALYMYVCGSICFHTHTIWFVAPWRSIAECPTSCTERLYRQGNILNCSTRIISTREKFQPYDCEHKRPPNPTANVQAWALLRVAQRWLVQHLASPSPLPASLVQLQARRVQAAAVWYMVKGVRSAAVPVEALLTRHELLVVVTSEQVTSSQLPLGFFQEMAMALVNHL